jgi:hypothetical protein
MSFGVVDNAIAARVAYLIVTEYKDWPACKDGTIDETGKFLEEPKTEKERDNWTALHRLVWRLREILAKAPGGESKIARLGSTYLLMKESENYEPIVADLEKQLEDIIEESGIGCVAGANVGNDEGLGTTKRGKLVKRKSFKEFSKALTDGVTNG